MTQHDQSPVRGLFAGLFRPKKAVQQAVDTSKMIFVFGSNEAGRHGAGAAFYAEKHKGAAWGRGFGPYGQSYALPTKDTRIQTLSHHVISHYVKAFIKYAERHPDLEFQVTQVGCGLAGLQSKNIAPMFQDAPSNCFFDTAWRPWLGEGHRYWGTL